MSGGITVEVTQQSETALLVRLSEASKDAQAGMHRGVEAAAITLASYIKKELLSGQVLKNRTGNLRRAVFSRMDGDVGIVGVGAEAPYGKFQEYGVDHPWKIEAKDAHSLRFVLGGSVIFAKSVTHPGLKERPFMRRGLSEETPKLRTIIQQYVGAAVAKKEAA